MTGSVKNLVHMRTVSYALIEALAKGFNIKDGTPEMLEVNSICGIGTHVVKDISVEKYVEVLNWAAKHYYPALPLSEGLYNVGWQWFGGYRSTILGRVLMASLPIIGPHRLLKRIPEMFSRSTNFGERTVQQLGPQEYLLSFRGVPIPGDFYLGVFYCAAKAAGVAKPTIKYQQLNPEDMDFTAYW